MASLKEIADTVQKVAEAISHALGIETEIVDNKLTIIGGTGGYGERLGQKEEMGLLDGDYLYARVLRNGKTTVVTEATKDLTYGPSTVSGDIKELAEICTPIKMNNKIIGVIGLVAFEDEQKKYLLEKQYHMVSFVERMADLLGAKAWEAVAFRRVEFAKDEITTILETIHEAMVAIGKKGYITHCNYQAEVLLGSSRGEMIGKHLSLFMPDTPALKVIEKGEGYTEREEIFRKEHKKAHFIVTAKPIQGKQGLNGVVISFRDIVEAQRLIYNMGGRTMKYTFDDIIGISDSIVQVKKQALLVARGNSTVLINGESGTGKELFARAIHYTSPRYNEKFVTVNCGAIPENLLESELFGYESGAFTGAKAKGKIGKFELADGGTIFLDEIGDMPLHLQVKILHVLQNKRFERVGGNKTITCDVRVITATNRDLEEMIVQKRFREDLYYRLSVIPLKIPPLRERIGDITILKDYFLKKYNGFMNKDIKGFSEETERLYLEYDWPGNVRELENAVEYGVNMTFGDEIEIEAVPPRLKKIRDIQDTCDENLSLQQRIKRLEKDILMKKISEYGSSKEAKLEIAKDLKISRATLYRKLSESNLS